jgi:hypothetical protein
MSAWGVGPFQNDGALDYRNDLIEKLVREIDTVLSHRNACFDDLLYLHGVAEILHAIVRQCGNGVLTKATVAQWIRRVKEIGAEEKGTGLRAEYPGAFCQTLVEIERLPCLPE